LTELAIAVSRMIKGRKQIFCNTLLLQVQNHMGYSSLVRTACQKKILAMVPYFINHRFNETVIFFTFFLVLILKHCSDVLTGKFKICFFLPEVAIL
jgi:hypothetical protein